MRTVTGYTDYKITEDGVVYSHKSAVARKLSLFQDSKGYLRAELWQQNLRSRPTVHKLMAEAFLTKPAGATLVRHLDDNKLNNHVTNLAWGTHDDNVADAIRNGVLQKPGEKMSRGSNLLEAEVWAMREMYGKGGYREKDIAERFSVSVSTAHRVLSFLPPYY